MIIVTWTLFVILSAACIAFLFAVYSLASDKDSDSPIYLVLINYIFITILFYISRELFTPIVCINIWKIANVSYLIFFIVCSLIYYSRISLAWKLTLPSALILTCVPFALNIRFTDNTVSLIDSFTNNYPKIIFSFWLPILIISTLILLAFSFIQNSNKKERDRLLRVLVDPHKKIEELELSEIKNIKEKERYLARDIEDKLVRSLIEEVQYRLDRNLKMNEELYYRQREIFEKALEIGKGQITNKDIIKSDKSIANFEKILLDVTKKLDSITKKESPKKIGLYSNPNNQNFIRELYHFLITPLSQIETKTILFDQNPNAKDQNKFKKDILTIKTSVEICKSVLAAYRELAFITTSSDWSPESLNLSTIAACNLYIEGSGKEITIDCNLDSTYPPYSNNYLLALLLPLIENAIKASPPQSQVNIIAVKSNSEVSFVIKNKAIKMPTLEQLNTSGFSSKPDHVGTGLLIARHLVEDQNAGSLKFTIHDNIITTTIILPKAKTHES